MNAKLNVAPANSAPTDIRGETRACCGACARKRGTFKRIVVAVDASEQAAAATDVAANLAVPLKADVVLVNVFRPDVGLTPELGFIEPDVRGTCIEAGRALLDGVRRRLPRDLTVRTELREGDPASEIVRAAAACDADLIVIGTHGRGRVAQALLGSTAAAVTRQADCPVMTVASHPCHDRSKVHDAH